jgi:hypothetical protein
MMLATQGTAAAAGPFGPPQPVSVAEGGLHTAIGYWYHEDKYKNGADTVIKQNQLYSHVGYGARNLWEMYARIGLADLKAVDAFAPANSATATSKNDFEEHWKVFGTVGAKGFYPLNDAFGIGAFAQGSYFFRDFTDSVAGTQGGAPFAAELRVKDLWDVNFGIGFQATVPYGMKLYAGPYIYYSEAKVSPSADISGLKFAAGDTTIKNKTIAGGFTGMEVPLAKGFRLNVEGQYSERFSVGAQITYRYKGF